MKKIMLGALLGFIPFLANCASSQHVLSTDSKLDSKNEYYPVYRYSEKNKQGYVGLGLAPDKNGLSGMMVFSAMAYEDKKKLFEKYKTSDDRLIYGPRKHATILLNNNQFANISVARNIRHISLYFPYITSNIKFIEQIVSQHNEVAINIDKKIKFTTEKDARKKRLDWLNTEVFHKNEEQNYSDQAQLKVAKRELNSLGIRAGCLSSETKGKVKNIAIFMTEVGADARINNFKVIDLEFSDPALQTSLISEVNIKLKKKTIVPLHKQHDFKLVCTTTKGIQLSTRDSFISTMKPRHREY